MDFNCPSCNKSGNIDDAKLLESGVYATCPQCNNKFLIKPEASKDFLYENVAQAEPQHASLKAPAANTPLNAEQDNLIYQANTTKIKSGIGGWLSFLIFGLTIWNPLSYIGRLFCTYGMIYENRSYYNPFPSYLFAMKLDDFLMLGIVVFSIITGIRLSDKKRNAVGLAKCFFVTSAIMVLIEIVLVVTSDIPITDTGILNLTRLLFTTYVISNYLVIIIWYSYLCRSKRIAATYKDIIGDKLNGTKIQRTNNTNLAWAIGVALAIIVFIVLVLAVGSHQNSVIYDHLRS